MRSRLSRPRESLRQRFADHPNIEIVHADVREIDTILKARKIEKVDFIISGLPTPSLPISARIH